VTTRLELEPLEDLLQAIDMLLGFLAMALQGCDKARV
jgi:hypothetical protein